MSHLTAALPIIKIRHCLSMHSESLVNTRAAPALGMNSSQLATRTSTTSISARIHRKLRAQEMVAANVTRWGIENDLSWGLPSRFCRVNVAPSKKTLFHVHLHMQAHMQAHDARRSAHTRLLLGGRVFQFFYGWWETPVHVFHRRTRFACAVGCKAMHRS